jgi:hypothetical protein
MPEEKNRMIHGQLFRPVKMSDTSRTASMFRTPAV